MSNCEHHWWYWRRRRNQNFGYWECVSCGRKTENVPLDENGRAALTADEALRVAEIRALCATCGDCAFLADPTPRLPEVEINDGLGL